MIDVRHHPAAGTVEVAAPFHPEWTTVARRLGGSRQGGAVTWTFPADAEREIRAELARLFPHPPAAGPFVGTAYAGDRVRRLRAVAPLDPDAAPELPRIVPQGTLTLPDGVLTVAPTVNDVGVAGVRFTHQPHLGDLPPVEFVVTAGSFARFMDAAAAAYATAVELPPGPVAGPAPDTE